MTDVFGPRIQNALAAGSYADPFSVLGMHETADGHLTVRACLPGARSVDVIDAASGPHRGRPGPGS